MNYKGMFKLNNGIEGEVKLTAQNDSDAFMAGCRMFALFDEVEWNLDKMESIFRPKKELKKALEDVERLEEQAKMVFDWAQDQFKAMSEELEGSCEWRRCDELVDKLYDATEYIIDVKKYLQEALKLTE